MMIFITLIGILSFVARLLPHAPNFTPIGALALFVGVYAARKYRWSLFVPLVAMFLADLVIGFYDFKLMAVVYASFLAYGVIGMFIGRIKSIWSIVAGTLGGALFFYVATNFAVWLFASETVYPHNFQGLLLSYTLALPFFKYTLLGDFVFTGIFFGIYELATSLRYKYLYGSKFGKIQEAESSETPLGFTAQ